MPGLAAVQADLLLTNGRILTMSASGPPLASALAVIGDRVAAVGDHRDILSLRGPRTRLLDLHGRLALPGFTDSHLHLGALALRLSQLNLGSAHTLSQVISRVGAQARRTPLGRWIIGRGFDKNRWGHAFPTRHELDPAAPHHPVALSSRDGHTLWVNSLALQRCQITPRTQAPPGGVIMRDARGRPTGILQETATRLIYRSPAFEARRAGQQELAAALRSLLRRGLTSAHLMEETELLGPLQALRESGKLRPRVTLYRHLDTLDDMIRAGVRSGLGDEWLRIGGIKLLVDGALGSQTAWLFRPYEGGDAGCGVPVLRGKELHDIVGRAARAGLSCAIHAIGDRANAETLGALAEVRDTPTPLPHRIEHAQLLRPQDIPRFARLGLVASMQPCHILGDIGAAERYWGARSRWAYPLRSLLKAGATLAFGSDAPVETADPIAGIYAAVQRQSLDGQPMGGWHRREQGIGLPAALRAYTLGPAKATGEAAFKGQLRPGYLADIVVLSEDVTRLRGPQLPQARVDLVLVGGRLRCQRRRAP